MVEGKRTKGLDEIFCPSCGEIIKREAVICVKCGVPIRGGPFPGVSATASHSKSKVVAILLAVFLGFWTWLYTYQRDGWKFWLNLGLSIVTLGIWGIVAWIWAIVAAAVRPEEFYASYPNWRRSTST
ncbi:MAG: zinc ribbon domain-containing protein [Chloroflexi bacterium]|nr:zinc ribbon domain-containing protein [Chloroflexota bacterium]